MARVGAFTALEGVAEVGQRAAKSSQSMLTGRARDIVLCSHATACRQPCPQVDATTAWVLVGGADGRRLLTLDTATWRVEEGPGHPVAADEHAVHSLRFFRAPELVGERAGACLGVRDQAQAGHHPLPLTSQVSLLHAPAAIGPEGGSDQSGPFRVSFTWSEAVEGFDAEDVHVGGIGGTLSPLATEDGITFTRRAMARLTPRPVLAACTVPALGRH